MDNSQSPAWTGSVRVRGFDAPEIRGECDIERQLAVLARDYVRDILTDETVVLTDIEDDKYGGRVLADVHLESGANLADLLTANGYGREYDGGTRQSWCDGSVELPPDPEASRTTYDPLDDPNHPPQSL